VITHTVRVVNREIRISNRKLIANNQNSDFIKLVLDDEWDGKTVLIVLGTGYDSLVCEYEGDPVPFPDTLLESTGSIPISIVGYSAPDSGENSRIITAKSDKDFEVQESGELPRESEVTS